MEMPLQLVITNIGYAISIIFTLCLGTFVFFRNPRQHGNIIFFILSISITIFALSYVIGANIHDPHLSRFSFMFNLSTLFMTVLNLHLVFWITKSVKDKKGILYLLYGIATLLTIFFIANPDSFLLPSQPQLYLTNFFVIGKLYFLGDIFFYCVFAFFIFYLIKSYYLANYLEKKRLKYFFLGFVLGYGIGLLPAFLLYGIQIDPFWSFLFGPLYTIPMAYAMIRYDVIDINIIAKRALLYALSIGGVMFFFIIINSVNDSITDKFPFIPIWLAPLLSSIIAVTIGVFVWGKIKEVDILKYEFINVIMHKFRTPLTAVKWSLESLSDPSIGSRQSAAEKSAIDAIKAANIRLIELTNTMVSLTFLNNTDYKYSLESLDIQDIVRKINSDLESKMRSKNLTVSHRFDPSLPQMNLDKEKMQFALQTIIENAINYTPQSGTIDISFQHNARTVSVMIKDSGIGITKYEIPHIFSKFFRGADARDANTEGVGIGLHLTQEIVHRHGGELYVESEGQGKGTTTTVTLPIIR